MTLELVDPGHQLRRDLNKFQDFLFTIKLREISFKEKKLTKPAKRNSKSF